MKYSKFVTIGLVWLVVIFISLNQADARMVRESREEKFLHDIDKLIEKLKSKEIENKIKSGTSVTVKLSTPLSLKDAIFKDGKLFINWALLFEPINKKEGYFHDKFKFSSLDNAKKFLKCLKKLKEIVKSELRER